MRRFLRWTGIAVGAGMVLLVALWFAFPAREAGDEGPADPILWLRRPVVKALHQIGVLPRGWVGHDDWIPSTRGASSWKGPDEAEKATMWSEYAVESEPVYRGLFWRVGFRMTVKVDARGREAGQPDHVRLWFREGGKRTVVADGGPGEPAPDGKNTRWAARGYVPAGIDEYGYEEVNADGTTCCGASWSR